MPSISAYKSDIGRSRKGQNEDYIWVDDQAGLYIVADGMGGQEGGEVASRLAADMVGQAIVKSLKAAAGSLSGEAIKELIFDSIEEADLTIHKASQAAGYERGMGTTIVAVLIQGEMAYISHAGDSRAYLARSSNLTQLTKDDSWGVWLRETTGSKANLGENILTKAVGQGSRVDPSFIEVKLTPDDCLLLCSDGLWNMLNDEQILAELDKAGRQIDQAVEALVSAANAAGGKDNISVILIKNLPLT